MHPSPCSDTSRPCFPSLRLSMASAYERRDRRPMVLLLTLLLVALLAAAAPARGAPVDAYRGAGAWVSQYDAAVLEDPWPALLEMRAHGVRTVFLETGNYRLPRGRDFRDRVGDELVLAQAHALGMRVVAWYLPGLADVALDLRRTRAALALSTQPAGEGFDGFAVDIESTLIGSIRARNRALLSYTHAVRAEVGPDYPLGAIVPDERSATTTPG